ncbi:methyl-accepting chemotaxis protein, partial [Vibrio cholerae]
MNVGFVKKLIFISSFILLVTVAFVVWEGYTTAKKEVSVVIEDGINEIINKTERFVSLKLESDISLASSIVDSISLRISDEQYINDIINGNAIKKAFLSTGFGFDSNGKVIENDPNWEPEDDYDPRSRGWYQEAKKNKRIFITEPYLDTEGKNFLVSISSPVADTMNNFIGAMYFDVDLSRIQKNVDDINLFEAGYVFITSNTGKVIIHSNTDELGKNVKDIYNGFRLDKGKVVLSVNGVNKWLYTSPIWGGDWFIIAVIDESIAMQSINKMKYELIFYSAIGLVFGGLILVFILRRLMSPLKTLDSAIKDIASGGGDLTKKLDTNLDKEFSELALGFNSFTEMLGSQIRQLKTIASGVLDGAEKTANEAEVSRLVVEQQLQELEQLATAMNEMAMTASEVANSAQVAADAAKEGESASLEGSSVVHETTDAIQRLSIRIGSSVEDVKELVKATDRIETVLDVINDIADQTNLLALNAAIEAARAGESGRGFAVVADEVRTLAQRTQQSTMQISEIIEQLQEGAKNVSRSMDESKLETDIVVEKTNQVNEKISLVQQAIHRISDMNLQIASAAEEQSLVAEEINNNTVNIKDLSIKLS